MAAAHGDAGDATAGKAPTLRRHLTAIAMPGSGTLRRRHIYRPTANAEACDARTWPTPADDRFHRAPPMIVTSALATTGSRQRKCDWRNICSLVLANCASVSALACETRIRVRTGKWPVSRLWGSNPFLRRFSPPECSVAHLVNRRLIATPVGELLRCRFWCRRWRRSARSPRSALRLSRRCSGDREIESGGGFAQSPESDITVSGCDAQPGEA